MTEFALLMAMGNLAATPVIFWIGMSTAAAQQSAAFTSAWSHAFARMGSTDADTSGKLARL